MSLDNEEALCKVIGKEILEKARAHEPSVMETLWWERQAISFLTGDQEAKAGALRFVDVFPSLKSSHKISQHLVEYLPDPADRLPEALHLGGKVFRSALMTPGAAAAGARLAINKMAQTFIIGATQEETAKNLSKLRSEGFLYTVDLLGEATLAESEADYYSARYVKLIEYLAGQTEEGAGPPHISVKLSALTSQFNPIAEEKTSAKVRERLRPIFRAAIKNGAHVTIDMENYPVRDLTLKIFRDILEEDEFSQWENSGIVAQAYLLDAEEKLDKLIEWIDKRGKSVTVRLVKGAYWEQETVAADQSRWPVPVRQHKCESDAAFERMLKTLLARTDIIYVAVATHNIRSIAKALAITRERGIPSSRFEIQMLLGMGDEIKRALVEMGFSTRVYAPSGELLPGMAYLVRRILENSSNESFLRQSFVEDRPEEELLANPALEVKEEASVEKSEIELCRYNDEGGQLFLNEPEPQWHKKEERDAIDVAIEEIEHRLGEEHELFIDGSRVSGVNTFASTDPSKPDRVVGVIHEADEKIADEAMEKASQAFADWKLRAPSERTRWLMAAAESIRERKEEMAAWQMFEVGKTRGEAMADVDEAIDHLNYYAIEGEKLNRQVVTQEKLGETNWTRFIARGAGVVISPWNFPLAILAGLSGAALAAGNTIVIKPSSISPVTAALFVDILQAAGIPDGVVNFAPGGGGVIGSFLANHEKTAFVAFTGSFDVGGRLAASSAEHFAKRKLFAKVVAEMGGKNAVIVDDSADIDEAVKGVVRSAFGFGGQKCSACSRVIVLKEIYDSFVQKLIGAVESLAVGSPFDPSTDYGPLAEEAAIDRVEKYIGLGREGAEPLYISPQVWQEGFFTGPALFGNVDPESDIANDEIFGPLLSIIPASDINGAITIANKSRYALTGGVFTRTPSTVKAVIEKAEAGNLYINRGITGAIVERQPFGGFKCSGLGGAKAGSVHLLRELSLSQTVTENIVRHGFSPDLIT